jgi:hypothetical protein
MINIDSQSLKRLRASYFMNEMARWPIGWARNTVLYPLYLPINVYESQSVLLDIAAKK